MKVKLSSLLFGMIMMNSFAQSDSLIRLNSLGYLPTSDKKATIIGTYHEFVVKSAGDNSVVFSGKPEESGFHEEYNQNACIADFSLLTKPGMYYLEVPGIGKSPEFKIDYEVFDFAYYTTMRGFYLLRCGTEVKGAHQGVVFEHQTCHMNDGWMDYTGFGNTQRDGVGGWHDAGDYGKYTVNAGITIGLLFMTWKHFSDKLEKCNLDIPESDSSMPDFLKEIKWETDWLLKMQYPDNSGRVCHKLTRASFEGFILPEDDTVKRYFSDWSSDATAQFSAVMALAARYFEPYDKQYAAKCLEAALKSYKFLQLNPEFKEWQQPELKTGAYNLSDKDGRLWMAAELWETTGDATFLTDFETRLANSESKYDLSWDWGNVKNLGVLTYLISEKKGKNLDLVQSIKKEIIGVADTLVNFSKKDIYARPFDKYFWGCNGTVARQSLTLYMANTIENKKEYRQTAINILDHIFGRNYYGRSYVTGLGHKSPMEPHDRRSGGDNITEPWPGYLVGGGHTPTDWKDEWRNFRTNEIAINWQASLVFPLAWFSSF